MDESYHLQYYGNRSTLSHPTNGDPAKIEENMQKIRSLLEDGTPVYMGSTAFSYDTADNLQYDRASGALVNSLTGKPYTRLAYDPNSKSIKQLETGLVVPLTGRWMLELFQNYKVTYIGSYENEDWHHNVITEGKFKEHLFKIEAF